MAKEQNKNIAECVDALKAECVDALKAFRASLDNVVEGLEHSQKQTYVPKEKIEDFIRERLNVYQTSETREELNKVLSFIQTLPKEDYV